MPSIELRPPLMRSSQTSVERRVSAAVLPFAIAVRALNGDAPSMRMRWRRCPPSSRMATDTIQLFFFASASAAALILRQSSRVSIGRCFIGFRLEIGGANLPEYCWARVPGVPSGDEALLPPDFEYQPADPPLRRGPRPGPRA